MSTPRYKALVIEDEKQIQKLLQTGLEGCEFAVKICGNLKDGITQVALFAPDVILLDLGLPDGDGKQFLTQARELTHAPIIIVSARSSENEIVDSLNLGADDYVVKPFFMRELVARINSSMRRSQKVDGVVSVVSVQNLELNIEKREVKLDGETLRLTPIEYNLLKYFMLNAGKALTHYNILKEVWGVGYQNDTKTLRVFVNQLRKKIESNPNMPNKLIAISGVGYRFC